MSDVNRHHNRVNRGIRKVARFYRRRMSPLIRWRWVFLPLMLLLLLSTLLVIPYVGLELYADDSLSFFFVRIWMPEGASIEETDQVARAIEEVAMTLPREEVISVVTQVGRLDTESDRIFSKDVAMVKVDLVEPTARERSLEEIMAELESRTSHVTGFRRIEFAKISGGPPLGRPIEVKVKGTYFEDLERLSNRLKDYLATIPGVHSIQDDLEKGKNELRVRIDESRAHLVGLDKSDIARQIKYAFEG
ncbi:MAG TPA: efflux RND transporter permease subunit, partial [Acidobacteriota bacterium]|nr:efflux RND transporter permease subunit [Acidobacteriota bacterium]